MAGESRRSLEKLKAMADINHALAAEMAELLKLRAVVQKAEEAIARKSARQRRGEIISAYRAKTSAPGIETRAKHCLATQRGNEAISGSVARTSGVISLEQYHEARIRNGTRKTKNLPGRLFMKSQWH